MLNVTKYLVILYLLLPLCTKVQAQPCSFVLYGTVKDGQSQNILPGATVSLIGSNQKAVADARGHFHFNNLCAKTYEIEVSYVGYEKRKVTVSLTKNLELEILLQFDGNELSTVSITGKKLADPITTTEKVEQMALELSKGESLGDILKRIPGVNTIQTGPTISKPVIHGMHSNRILILNSGVRIEGQQWGNEHAPEVDPLFAKELTVVKGAAGVQYGSDALGGIILAEPAPLNYHLPFSAQLNIIGASNSRMGNMGAQMAGAFKDERFAWQLQGSAKKAGNASTPKYFLNNTGYEEVNGALTLGYKGKSFEAELFFSTFNTTLGIFEDAHIGNQDDLNSRIALGRPSTDGYFSYAIKSPRQEVNHHLLKIKGKKYFGNNSSLNAVYSFQKNFRQEYDIRRGDRSDVPSIDLSLSAQNLELIYEQAKPNNISNKYGVNASIIVNNNVPGTFVTPIIPNYDSFNPALFFIKKLQKDKYGFELGLRYDYKSIDAAGYDSDQNWYGGKHTFHNISGSFGSIFYLDSSFNFRSDVNIAWRPPSVNELYSGGLHHGTASVEYGNPDFNSEKGYKWINSLSFSKEKININLSGYLNYINGYIFLEPTGGFETSLRGTFPVFNYTQSNALFTGADLFGTFDIHQSLSWRLKGSFLRAKDLSDNSFLPMIPTDRIDNSLTWKIKHSSENAHAPFIELQHIYVSKQRRHNPNSDFSPPPPAYQLFNVSAGTHFRIKEQYLGVNASIFNLLNASYKDYLNRFRYYAHENGRNFVIRLSYKF